MPRLVPAMLALALAAAPAFALDRDVAPSIPVGKPAIDLPLPTPVVAPPPEDAPKHWNLSFSEAILSQYCWRGIRQRPNAGAVLQTNVAANHKRWTFTVWSSLELTGKNDGTFFPGDRQRYKITEGDYLVDYAWAKGKYKFNSGIGYYRFPNTPWLSTQELYQTVVFPGKLAPTFTLYQDIDENRGQYGVFGLTRAWDAWTLAAQVAYSTKKYNNFWFGVNRDGFANSAVTLSYARKTKGAWTITPSVCVHSILDEDLRNSAFLSNKPDNTVVGVTFGRAF